jgi:hypothetical protein
MAVRRFVEKGGPVEFEIEFKLRNEIILALGILGGLALGYSLGIKGRQSRSLTKRLTRPVALRKQSRLRAVGDRLAS